MLIYLCFHYECYLFRKTIDRMQRKLYLLLRGMSTASLADQLKSAYSFTIQESDVAKLGGVLWQGFPALTNKSAAKSLATRNILSSGHMRKGCRNVN